MWRMGVGDRETSKPRSGSGEDLVDGTQTRYTTDAGERGVAVAAVSGRSGEVGLNARESRSH